MKPPIQSSSQDESQLRSVRVWDFPTRLFHWSLVILVIASFVTGNIGGNLMTIHMWSGYGIFALVLFRLAWGFVGGRQSRFVAFVRGPGKVLRYASEFFRTKSPPHLGHNPLGGWSIIAILLALSVQVGTGLFANDNILTEGPLYPLVSKDVSDWLTDIHQANRIVLAALLAIHVFAVFYHLIAKKENLLKPMVTGIKQWRGPADVSTGNPWLAIVIAVLVAVVVYFVIS